MAIETAARRREGANASIAARLTRGWAWLRVIAESTAGRLFAFFACLYLLTYKGSLTAIDGILMYETTQSMVDHGSLAVARADIAVPGQGGLYYSFYGIGTSLVQLPFYVAGRLLGHLAHSKADQIAIAVTELVFPLVSALCCVIIYAMARVLGYPRATAVRAALALGLLTSVWVYAKMDFSEPLLTLAVTAAVLGAFACARASRERDLLSFALLTGVALGWAILTKYIALAFVPLFCVYLLWTMPRPRSITRVAKQQALLLAPVALAGVITLLVNALRFGSPFNTGYPPGGRLFTIPIVVGDWGLLLSAYRGLVWYDPLLFAGLLLLPLLAWRRPREGLLPLALVLVTLVLYGGFVVWWGGTGYGPRYLLQVMPLLLLPLLALGWLGPIGEREPLLPPSWHPWLRAAPWGVVVRRTGLVALWLVVAASFVITLLGVLVNPYIFDVYQFGAGGSIPLWASPLTMAIWVVPLSLSYAVTRSFPAGYGSSSFPFGPPYPHAVDMPQALGEFYAQNFWFTLTPRPLVALLIGGAVLGAGLVLSGRALWPVLRGPPG